MTFRTISHESASAIEDDEYVALRAPIPIIPDMPPSICSDDFKLSRKLYTTQLLMLNQNHNWKHVPSCFKTSGHVKRGNCRYTVPRKYQKCAEVTDDGAILAKRTIGSEYMNNLNPVLLHVVRSNHDIRFLTSSTHEIYYVLK